jgi:hypothetical protein
VGAEGVEEALQGGAGHALTGPDDRAVAVVVGDHGQVAVALAVGDLVDADAVQAFQAGVVEVGGDHPHRDGRDRLEGAAQQPGDGGRVGALGQVGTTSSKSRVNRAPGRAHGIVSVRTRPQARQASRRISASR